MKTLLIKLVCIQIVLLGTLTWAQQESRQAPAPDNSKINQRDRNPDQPTADQQKSNKSDREVTRAIRRALVKDKTLSSYAHNIKVISENGVVTLKGPVRTQEEKQLVEAKAAEVVGGPGKIHSELEVTGVEASKKPSPGHYANR